MSLRKDLGLISCDCSRCGNCCQRRGIELSLTPLDVFNISHYLNISTKDFVEKYCDVGRDFDVRIRTIEFNKKCIFFTHDFEKGSCYCQIYDVRPMACYLYPLKSGLESKDSFFIDSGAPCPTSDKQISYSEYVERNSNGRYDEEFKHYKYFCMAIGAFYCDKNSPSLTEMFEYLFYNESAEEAKQKLVIYLFGKKHEDTA